MTLRTLFFINAPKQSSKDFITSLSNTGIVYNKNIEKAKPVHALYQEWSWILGLKGIIRLSNYPSRNRFVSSQYRKFGLPHFPIIYH